MTGISPHVITHVLNVNPDMPPIQQKRHPLDPVKADALEKEVDKLLTNRLIRDVYYSEWLANPVLVPKPNGTWWVCIDFTDLNKAYPKDCFPLPRIDQMVDATSGFKLLSFMDAYSEYNQIKMHIVDKEMLRSSPEVWNETQPKEMHFRSQVREIFGIHRQPKGIEENPEKIQALLNMPSPKKHKDVQSLTGKNARRHLEKLKEHMAKPPILSKSVHREDLLLYLAVFENAVSVALVREEDKVQHPVYYVSKRMIGAEIRYRLIEKLVFCLLMASRKVRPYFQAHPIKVPTNHPLRQVLQKPEASGRLLKWAMELSQFDIHYVPRISIKGHALADFITECNEAEASSSVPVPRTPAWKVFVDGASNENRSSAGIAMISLDGLRLQVALHFSFPASNNEAEYEALIPSLKLAKAVGAAKVEIFSDSQLVVNQVSGEYQTHGEKMAAYVAIVRELLHEFT
ncbi:uncharacterized protein LOC133034526 [Cannabis sativa]|uniref:uncharacterized protein LOC133034526 n=1 Tax=Cannabis sativa TaxID=3483 RepID=UPI0029CA3B01|nr:uncharacterized protein LOC133034526 [Cannabis sativa]